MSRQIFSSLCLGFALFWSKYQVTLIKCYKKKLSQDTHKISHLKKQKLFNKRLQYIVSCIYDSFLNIWVSLILQYTTSEHIHVHDSENHARSSVTIVSSILVSLGCKFAPRSSPNQLWTHINRTKILFILTVIVYY